MRTPSRPKLLAAGGVAVTALAAGMLVNSATSSSASPSVRDASRLLNNALIAQQQILVPATAKTSLASAKAAPAAALTSMRATGRTRLASLFTDDALTKANQTLDAAVAKEQDPTFVVLGGGATNFAVTEADVGSDGTIHLNATVDSWSLVGQIQGSKIVQARPQNTLLVTAIVTKTPNGPRISRLEWTFAPGSEP